MEVQFSPGIQAGLEQSGTETGRSKDDFVEDPMAGYFDEVVQVRLHCDDIKSGRVKLIPGDEVIARVRAESAERSTQEALTGCHFDPGTGLHPDEISEFSAARILPPRIA